MKYLDRIKQNVARLTPSKHAALIAFQKDTQEPSQLLFDANRYHWMQEENPHRRETGPQFWIYQKGDKVLGQQVGIPFCLSVRGKPYRGSWAVDLLLSPQSRLRGIGNVLNSVLQDENDVTVGIGISPEALKSFLRAGWVDLGKLPVFIRPLDARRILPLLNRHPDFVMVRFMAALCNIPLRLLDIGARMMVRFSGVVLEPVPRFDPRVDRVWETASRSFPVLAKRDYESLRWRFDLVPEASCYQRYYLCKGSRVCGYIVVRHSSRDAVSVATIVDFLSPPALITPMMAACIGEMRGSGAAVVYCRAGLPKAGRSLYPLGFCRRPSCTHVIARANEKSGLRREQISDPLGWFITTADSDGDYQEASDTLAHHSLQGSENVVRVMPPHSTGSDIEWTTPVFTQEEKGERENRPAPALHSK